MEDTKKSKVQRHEYNRGTKECKGYIASKTHRIGNSALHYLPKYVAKTISLNICGANGKFPHPVKKRQLPEFQTIVTRTLCLLWKYFKLLKMFTEFIPNLYFQFYKFVYD